MRACCYRSGSAVAARSRATDPAATRAYPAAIRGLRRCTARATKRTVIAAYTGGGPLRPRVVCTGPPVIIGPRCHSCLLLIRYLASQREA
jgi:hypothetical protein